MSQPNGPRRDKSHGRLRQTLTNTASKQDVNEAQKPGESSYGGNTRPRTPQTKFQREGKLQKIASKASPQSSAAPKVQTATPPKQMDVTPLLAVATLLQNGNNQNGGFPVQGRGPQANIQLGKQLAKEYGWSNEQWRALKQLWARESGWRTKAKNPTSSARGIPQAMASAHFGDDWQDSPEFQKFWNDPKKQILWGLNYIKGRYGDPRTALRFHNRNNYY